MKAVLCISDSINEFGNGNFEYFPIKITTNKKKFIKSLVKEVNKLLFKNNPKDVVKLLVLGFLYDSLLFSEEIKKIGFFRASKYDFSMPPVIRAFLKGFFLTSLNTKVDDRTAKYIKSVDNFLSITRDVKKLYEKIIHFTHKNDDKLFKTVVAIIDMFFMHDTSKAIQDPRRPRKLYTREALSEGASYLLYIHKDQCHLGFNNVNEIDENALFDPEYLCAIIDTYSLKEYMYSEIRIERFPYTMDKKESGVCLVCQDELFEKSRHLGFLMQDLANYKIIEATEQAYKNKAASFGTFFYSAPRLYDSLIVKLDHPVERWVLKISEKILETFKDEFLKDKYFYEELAEIKNLNHNHFVSENTFFNYKIEDDVTITDVFKFKRFIVFLSSIMMSFLKEKIQKGNAKEKAMAFRSLIPVFKKTDFINAVSILMPKNKVQSIVKLLSWVSKESNALDLQYTPFIEIESELVVPFNLFYNSNTVRNSLSLKKKRFYETNEYEPTVNMLYSSLVNKFENVCKNLKYRSNNEEGELDVILAKDGYLIVFEIKNSLHPCNIAELRTSFDYITYGAKRLNDFTRLFFSDEKLRTSILNRLGLASTGTYHIVPCIATGNRALYGYRHNSVAVRYIHELLNLINTGQITLGDKPVSTWKGSNISIDDLAKFIQEDSLYDENFSFFELQEASISYVDKKLIQQRYLYNNEAAQKKYELQ
ncbi:hypothetical protein [Solidesulfovibrio magneticus]|nr:hypothetical protein [Solidesulfovibrio magneticus]